MIPDDRRDWRTLFEKVFLWSVFPLSVIIYAGFLLLLTGLVVSAVVS